MLRKHDSLCKRVMVWAEGLRVSACWIIIIILGERGGAHNKQLLWDVMLRTRDALGINYPREDNRREETTVQP